jgi:microcystin-dependent protein
MATDIKISELNEITVNNDLNQIIVNNRENSGDSGITKKIQISNLLTPSIVKTTNITDCAITTNKIDNNAITCDKIAGNTITSDQVTCCGITNGSLATNSVDNRVINNSDNFTFNCVTAATNITTPLATVTDKLTVGAIGCGKTVSLNGINYDFPATEIPNYFLKTDGSGNLDWAEAVPGDGTALVFSDIVPVGTIIPWAGAALPADGKWLECNGTTFDGTTYTELSAVLGDTWGTHSGNNYFLPNLQGRVAVGAGTGDDGTDSCVFALGLSGGKYNHQLSTAEMPIHNHTIRFKNDAHEYGGAPWSSAVGPGHAVNERICGDKIQNAGGNQPHNNIQPYAATRYIIKAKPDDIQQFGMNVGPGLSALNASGGQTASIDLSSTEIGLKVSDDFEFDGSGKLEISDDFYRPGEIVQQLYYRVDDITRFDAELIGTTGDRKTTTSSAVGAKLISMQGLNFSRDGATARNMYAGEVSDLRISITPKYANSLIVIEMVFSCEPNKHNSGLWMGELNTSDEIQLITRTGYEGYNPNAQTGRNNFYSSGWYDGDDDSTMKSIPLTYIDKPNTTNQKTYSPIFGSASSDAFLVLNASKTVSNNYRYEYGVSTISIKEIRQS